jgi:monoamine oxidase
MPPSTPITRRAFVNLVGRATGAAAVYATFNGMGLLRAPPAYAGPPRLPPGSGRGVRVIILGAGIAGMIAAHELRKAGYRCTILEALDRPGGRCWTIRGGDEIRESGATQRVAWDRGPHLYFNAGAARIPHQHEAILGYCRELGVPLEVMVSDNRAALLHDDAAFGGRPQVARHVMADVRGFIAELAARSVAPGALDQALTQEDLVRLRDFLRAFGPLDGELRYRGSRRAGYAEAPGAARTPGRFRPPLALAEILRGAGWPDILAFGDEWEYAAPMLQPVGGMDRIARAFARSLGSIVRLQAEVVRLERVGERARVVWREERRERSAVVDHVLCTLPLPALDRLPADLSPPVRRAIAAGARVYIPAVKVAFQSDRRWWETEQHIYGGITWTGRDITQIWYPTAGIHGDKGILIGAYVWTTAIGERFAAMSPDERVAAAIADGEHIHPGYAGRVGRGASVAWSKMPFTGGAWAEWDENPDTRRDAYPSLLEPDGPFYFAGEHLTYLNSWQEGAARSAHRAVEQIAQRAAARR